MKTIHAYTKISLLFLPLGDGVYFTAGIADEEHGLFGLITEDEN